jgi:hypothetical protein
MTGDAVERQPSASALAFAHECRWPDCRIDLARLCEEFAALTAAAADARRAYDPLVKAARAVLAQYEPHEIVDAEATLRDALAALPPRIGGDAMTDKPSAEALPAWAITKSINELAEFMADGFFEVQTDAAARNERHVKRLAKHFAAAYLRGVEAAARYALNHHGGFDGNGERLAAEIRALAPPIPEETPPSAEVLTPYDQGYANGGNSVEADIIAAFDEILDLDVENAWDAAQKAKAAIDAAAADARRVAIEEAACLCEQTAAATDDSPLGERMADAFNTNDRRDMSLRLVSWNAELAAGIRALAAPAPAPNPQQE